MYLKMFCKTTTTTITTTTTSASSSSTTTTYPSEFLTGQVDLSMADSVIEDGMLHSAGRTELVGGLGSIL
jgi:hypothetical protein